MRPALAALLMLASAPPQALVRPLDPATTLVLVEDHRAPTVELRIEVPVGSWSPWFRRESGQAAWEALLLDPGHALLRRADALPLDVDTSVGTRACTLRAAFLREDLPQVVDLLRDAMHGSTFDRRELRRRARQRTLEWRLALKDPGFVLQRAAAAVLFREGDPRRLVWERPPGGVPSDSALSAAQRRMLALPGRVLGLAGDVDPEMAEAVARRLLDPADPTLPEGAASTIGPPIPLAARQDVARELTGLTQVYVADVRTSVPVNDEDAAAFAIADHVLGGHFYSRLYVALRHEGGETYGASTWKSLETVETMYAASTFTRTENAAVTERKLGQVLKTLQASGITEEERTAALGYLRGRLGFTRESPAQVLGRALLERRLGLAQGALDALVDRAEATSLAEVNAFVRRFYEPAAFRRVVVGDRHQ